MCVCFILFVINLHFLIVIREAKRAINNFLCLGCHTVIITLGKNGAAFASADSPRVIRVLPPPDMKVIDTTVGERRVTFSLQ